MKKLLSLFLAVCLVFSCCVLLSSCDEVSEKKMAKDPATVLSLARSATMAQMFPDEADIAEILREACTQGSMAFSLDAAFLREMGIDSIELREYFDKENKRGALDLRAEIDSKELSLLSYLSEDSVVLQSEVLLGMKDALLIRPDTLAEDYAASAWASVLTPGGDGVDEMVEALEMLADALNAFFEQHEMTAENANAALLTLEQVIASEAVFTEGSNEVDYVTVSYVINNATIRALLLKLSEVFESSEEEREDLNEFLQELDETAQINMTAKTYVNKKTGLVEKDVIDGEITIDTEQEEGTLDLLLTVSYFANTISVEAAAKIDDETYELRATLDKMSNDTSVIYDFSASVKNSGITVDLIDAEVTYHKGDNTFELLLRSEPLFDSALTIKGTIAKAEQSVTFALSSIKAGNETLELAKCELICTAGTAVPTPPADARDIMSLSESEVQGILINAFTWFLPEFPEWKD